MRSGLWLLLAVIPGMATAQRQAPAARGVASITADDVRRRIGIIADDSLLGRATPSAQLDEVAAYVAAEFRRSGLKPGGDSATYLQRYPLDVLRFEPESSSVRVAGRAPAMWRVGLDVLLIEGEPPAAGASGSGVLVTGTPQAGGQLDSAAVTGKVAFLSFGPNLNAIAVKLLALRPLALVLIGEFPDSIWRKFPGREATTRVRNPSQGGLDIPAVLVIRAATVGALFGGGQRGRGAPRAEHEARR